MHHIDPEWTFEEAIKGAWASYVGYGLESKGRRNAYLKAWGNVVGRQEALKRFDEFVFKKGSFQKAADSLRITQRTFKGLRDYFDSLPSREVKPLAKLELTLMANSPFPTDENRNYEFKMVIGSNPARSIQNTADEYAVAFLNSEGGHVLWGVRDVDHMILGIPLDEKQRDEIRRSVIGKIEAIRPHIDLASIRIIFHSLQNKAGFFVVELTVPQARDNKLHFTGGNETFIRLDGVKQKLQGPAIQEWIMARISNSSANM